MSSSSEAAAEAAASSAADNASPSKRSRQSEEEEEAQPKEVDPAKHDDDNESAASEDAAGGEDEEQDSAVGEKTGPQKPRRRGEAVKRLRKPSSWPGLKETAYTVLQLLRNHNQSTYAELVDALKERYAPPPPLPPDFDEYVKKRVYDVISVLMAMRLVRRDNKILRYEGDPPAEPSFLSRLGVDSRKLKDTPEDTKRNEGTGPVPEEKRVNLPFVVISAPDDTTCEATIGDNSMVLTFDKEFEMRDDVEVLYQMGLMNEITAAKIAEIVPRELYEFLPFTLRERVISGHVAHQPSS